MRRDIDTITTHYLVAAIWSSVDDNGDPMDGQYTLSDLAPETVAQARKDVEDFVTANQALLDASGLSDEQIGHDFWLTRNGHGAGFWDRGLSKLGNDLADAAKLYSGIDLYVGDDGRIYTQ